MRRTVALFLIAGMMLMMERIVSPDSITGLRTIGLAIGFALIAAALTGELAGRIQLPRVTGYLLFGLICGPYLLNLLTPVMARQLEVVNGLAMALIAFIAGLEMDFRRMRGRLAAMLSFSGVTIAVMFAGLLVMLFLAWPWLPIAPQAAGLQRTAMAVVLTTLVVSFSPAVTIAVIAEARARGPLSELALTFAVLGDLALILFFTLAMQFARMVSGGGPSEDVSLLVRLSWEIAGSLLYGGILGSVFALYLRFVGREIAVVLLGMCALITGSSAWLHFESLLTALAAGIVVQNIAPPRGDSLRDAVERGALPILVIFFAAAGASLQLDVLAAVGPAVIVLAIARFGWIWAGAAIGRRTARLDFPAARSAWMGMISQAGVTLGLGGIVAGEFSGWGTNVRTVLIAMIALHQVIGPILFRYSLGAAGEVGVLEEIDYSVQATPVGEADSAG